VDHIPRGPTDQRGDALRRLVDQTTRQEAPRVQAVRVAERLLAPTSQRLPHLGEQRRRGVVVEVDRYSSQLASAV
jgi:hypothetical protein